ncbi:ribosome silencing factor [Pikeienuella sp. HZG-20]|uniref:ribosome silencing factor n=1 Tax=Paludibacillus litoralis TaxID=3133267 RepID=UPI0030EBE4FE
MTGPTLMPPVGGGEEAVATLLAHICDRLDQDKAEDIVTIDIRGKSAMADYMVIASGRSTRQVSALSDHLIESLKQELGRTTRVEGKNAGDWVLIDAGDVIVHIFRPEVREFYQLEKMWTPELTEAAARMA